MLTLCQAIDVPMPTQRPNWRLRKSRYAEISGSMLKLLSVDELVERLDDSLLCRSEGFCRYPVYPFDTPGHYAQTVLRPQRQDSGIDLYFVERSGEHAASGLPWTQRWLMASDGLEAVDLACNSHTSCWYVSCRTPLRCSAVSNWRRWRRWSL